MKSLAQIGAELAARRARTNKIDEIVDAVLANDGIGHSSKQLRDIGMRYRKAHPQFTIEGQYSNDVYNKANRIYDLAAGVQRAERSGARMKREAAAWAKRQAKIAGNRW